MFCYENTENNALHENTGVAHNGVESIDVKGHEVPTSIFSSFPTQNAIQENCTFLHMAIVLYGNFSINHQYQ